MRVAGLLGLLFATYFIAGCATNTPAIAKFDAQKNAIESNFIKQGRIALRVATDPVQSLTATFVLQGTANQGELTLSSPLGNTLARLAWSPEQALLLADNTTTRYSNVNTLMLHVTGTTLPLTSFFEWMAGRDSSAEGWQVDLAQMQHSERPRFQAQRTYPAPHVDLRIVLDN